ncbi:uncharacterized protein LOC111313041 [Durio zibethinus]|uniref:Uncharacterized protein LOC111313041 n=1 Tax=Durio zibethinus TaxID=66656 RepID=A0A6P6AX72_DURZI|nr:uncharacterized protein LOC111313041 [Durio zibethinus]
MESQILHPKVAAFQPEWNLEDICMAFFKYTRWKVEETLYPINCPFHYFCDGIYPGNYPPAMDVLNTRYAFLEASTISGILHASVYLDSIFLPYYAGIGALASSTFSGE